MNKHLQEILEAQPDPQIQTETRATPVIPKQGSAEWGCFTEFNPHQRQSYLATIDNWSRACLSAFSSVLKIQQDTQSLNK